MLNRGESRKWHDLETIWSIVKSYDSAKGFRGEFTSIDRIEEIQDIVHLTTEVLDCHFIDNEETLKILRAEILVLRGYLTTLVNEFEDYVNRLDELSKSLRTINSINRAVNADNFQLLNTDFDMISTVNERGGTHYDPVSTGDVISSQARVTQANEIQAKRRIRRIKFSDLIEDWKSIGNELEWMSEGYWRASFQSCMECESLDLARLLVMYGVEFFSRPKLDEQLRSNKAKDLGIASAIKPHKAESQEKAASSESPSNKSERELIAILQDRGFVFGRMKSGKLVTALTDFPEEETRRLLKAYLEFGHDIWPGKRFIQSG